jgi:hypothetical protein
VAHVVEAVIVVFGLVVGSGLDSVLEEGFPADLASQEAWLRLLEYAIAMSVIARFTLGGALHLPHAHRDGVLRPLAYDISFFFAFGLMLRVSAVSTDVAWFFCCQMLLFALAICWGLGKNAKDWWGDFQDAVYPPQGVDRHTAFRPWSHWAFLDSLNLAIALVAWVCHVAGAGELVVLVPAALVYAVLLGVDCRLILRSALHEEPTAAPGLEPETSPT